MKVELISKTQGVNSYEWLKPDEIVLAVARHGKIKDSGTLTTYLLKNGHYSPFEHVSFGFQIETSRAISAQFARHWSLNFQEFSQRYSEVPSFEPIELRKAHEKNRQSSSEVFDPILKIKNAGPYRASRLVRHLLVIIKLVYRALLAAGVAKECARMILPMATTTIIHMTGTLRDWLAFLNQRCHIDTQKEAREIALLIGEALEAEIPEVMKALEWRSGKFM